MTPRWVPILLAITLSGCIGSTAEAPAALERATTQGHGLLEGSVVDQNFVAIPGAKVVLVGTNLEALTGWNGRFQFADLAPALYRIKVEAAGWTAGLTEAKVVGDHATKITVFLDPLAILEPYWDVRNLRGEITCVDVEAVQPTSLTCTPKVYDLTFQPDWAATVTQVVWGPSGFSSASQSQVTLRSKVVEGAAATYAHIVSSQPARVTLLPDRFHVDQGGTTATPPQGEPGSLQIELRKDPAKPVDMVGAAATLQQSFQIYHTTFYHAAPADLDDYSALPE